MAGLSRAVPAAARRWAAVWGNGMFGRLGHGSQDGEEEPRRVLHGALGERDLDVKQVACGGAHTAFVTGDGGVYTCGLNDHGQLGLGMEVEWTEAPTQVDIPEPVAAVAAGHFHTVCLTESGHIWSFGRNHRGQLGLGASLAGKQAVPEPMLVGGFGGAELSQVVAGMDHTMVVTTAGDLLAWGCNDNGRLGHGDESSFKMFSSSDEPAPRIVRSLRGVRVASAAAGHMHSGCVDDQGRVYLWGYGKYWQLASGHDRDLDTPHEVEGLHAVAQLSAGGLHTAALTRSGQLFTWGLDTAGELGTGGPGGSTHNGRYPGPVDAPRLASVSCGWKHTAAVTSEGRLLAWGWGGSEGTGAGGEDGRGGGHLGVGNPFDYWLPEPVVGILSAGAMARMDREVVAVSCGLNHTAAIIRERRP